MVVGLCPSQVIYMCPWTSLPPQINSFNMCTERERNIWMPPQPRIINSFQLTWCTKFYEFILCLYMFHTLVRRCSFTLFCVCVLLWGISCFQYGATDLKYYGRHSFTNITEITLSRMTAARRHLSAQLCKFCPIQRLRHWLNVAWIGADVVVVGMKYRWWASPQANQI